MNQTQPTHDKDILTYLMAQIQKINTNLVAQQQDICGLKEMERKVEKHSLWIKEIQKRIKVMEICQSQNFQNNQRLFKAHHSYDVLEKRVETLEGHLPQTEQSYFEGNKNIDEELRSLEMRVSELEEQSKKNRHKNTILNKFRREVFPINNCQSTKDISTEGKNDYKKLQKKLKDFIMQKVNQLQKKIQTYTFPSPIKKYDRLMIDDNVDKERRKTRLRHSETEKHITQHCFKNKMDNYYNQTSQKEEEFKTEETARKNKISSEKQFNKSAKKIKRKSKSNSKSSEGKKRKRQQVKSNDKTNLLSVNEYLRLRQYNHL